MLPSADRDNLVAPDAAPVHELPKNTEVESVLARVEDLIGRGHLGAALKAAAGLPSKGELAPHYEFLRHEKLARAHVGIADRYFLRGDAANARTFYERAVSPQTSDPTVRATAQLAGQVFDELGARRTALLNRLTASIGKDDYATWCADHSDLTRLTLLDVSVLRERISPDFRLEPAPGERPPIDPDPGYVDPLPAETELVDSEPAVPATVFSAHDVQVFAEPDPDLVRLCYKRFRRQRHVDTMAFPAFSSYLHRDRMRQLQARERNFFENVGLESSWALELLPDQPFDLSLVTDVRVSFQYEAMFDDNLKRVLEKKRYAGRKETAALSARKLGEARGTPPDFTGTFGWTVGPDLFEASVLERTIVNVGFLVSASGLSSLPGKATLEISYGGAAPVQVETTDNGVVATASGTPAGSGLAALETMAHGRPITGSWTGRVVDLPAGVSPGDVDDVLLLLNYEYAP